MKLEQYLNEIIKRYDKEPYLSYFTHEDYIGLQKEDFSFIYRDKKLNGGYFFYPEYKKDELVIFVNGIGSGNITYMSEIERIARAGYKVLSVDNLGDFSSEGDSIRSLSEALAILDYLLNYLATFSWYKATKIKLIGHSLGGYAVSNIMNYHNEISALVVISGFVSVQRFLQGMDSEYEEIFEYEKRMNPQYALSTSLDAIKGKEIPMLFIHSMDDEVISYEKNFLYLKNNINQNNIKFMTVTEKGHNPLYTKDGVSYMRHKFCELYKLNLEESIEFSKNIDFARIVKMDEEIINEVLKTLA